MRRKDREVTDTGTILHIADQAGILRLSLFDGEYPYIVPLHYGYLFENGQLVFYMHSAKEGRKLELIRANPRVCIELDCDTELISGGENPCEYGSSYASLIGRGTAEIVSDEEEKIKGLTLLMQNQTGRHFEIDGKMAASADVIKVTVTEYTAKARIREKPQTGDPEVVRAEAEWQRTGAYSVRIEGMNRQHHISLREEFDEHDGEGTKYIVLLDQGYPVATCRFYETGSDIVILGRVVVLPEYRGNHLGSRVVEEAEQWIRERGYSRIVIDSRTEAVPFYEKLGYVSDHKGVIHNGVFDCFRMHKNLK